MIQTRIIKASEDLSRHKRLIVGAGCPNIPEDTFKNKDVRFTEIVTVIWKWYHEQLMHDLDFLSGIGTKEQKKTLREFDELLSAQRHDGQHANSTRKKQASAWRAGVKCKGKTPSQSELIEALLGELEIALKTAIDIAANVHNDTTKVSLWVQHNANTPESQVMAALHAIGRKNLPKGHVALIVRQFTSNPQRKRARTAQDRAQIAAMVAVGLNLTPLSVPYDQILDDFNLIGDPRGSTLLLLAHGIEDAGKQLDPVQQDPVLKRVWDPINSSLTS